MLQKKILLDEIEISRSILVEIGTLIPECLIWFMCMYAFAVIGIGPGGS